MHCGGRLPSLWGKEYAWGSPFGKAHPGLPISTPTGCSPANSYAHGSSGLDGLQPKGKETVRAEGPNHRPENLWPVGTVDASSFFGVPRALPLGWEISSTVSGMTEGPSPSGGTWTPARREARQASALAQPRRSAWYRTRHRQPA